MGQVREVSCGAGFSVALCANYKVCARILTYAHVCSRMLTYADAESTAGVGVGQ